MPDVNSNIPDFIYMNPSTPRGESGKGWYVKIIKNNDINVQSVVHGLAETNGNIPKII